MKHKQFFEKAHCTHAEPMNTEITMYLSIHQIFLSCSTVTKLPGCFVWTQKDSQGLQWGWDRSLGGAANIDAPSSNFQP